MAFFLSTNIAFAMLYRSRQYGAAVTEAQQSILLSAGQALLAVTEGARMLPLMLLAGLLLSTVLLQSKIFGKVTAWAGILGVVLIWDVHRITDDNLFFRKFSERKLKGLQ